MVQTHVHALLELVDAERRCQVRAGNLKLLLHPSQHFMHFFGSLQYPSGGLFV